jgi:hypothetical protein
LKNISPNNLIPQLIALLDRLDMLAQQAADKGDAKQESYYYGVMFGLSLARVDLAQIVDEAKRARPTHEDTDQTTKTRLP